MSNKTNFDNLNLDPMEAYQKYTPTWVKALSIIISPGDVIANFITKMKPLTGTASKLRTAATKTFNLAIRAAIVAVGMGIACIFVSATWPVITAIALAGVAAAALATAITCISIACHQANKEDNPFTLGW